MKYLIFILLFASPAFAQCDSTADSIIHAQQLTIVEQAKQNVILYEQRVASDRRYEDMIRSHAAQDSIRIEQIADERWYSHSLEKEKPLYATMCLLGGVTLTLIVEILIHLH